MTDDFVCLLLSFWTPSQNPQTICNKESRKRCKAQGRGHIGGQQQEGKKKQIQRHNIFFSRTRLQRPQPGGHKQVCCDSLDIEATPGIATPRKTITDVPLTQCQWISHGNGDTHVSLKVRVPDRKMCGAKLSTGIVV